MAAPDQTPPQVLAIDDDPLVLQVAKRLLERSGFKVRIAATPAAALEVARAHDIGVVLLDLTLPGHEPDAVARDLRSVRPGIRIIACTGHDEARAAAMFPEREEPIGYVQKPFTGAALAAEVTRVLALSASP